MSRAPPLPTYPLAEVDPQIDPPQVQMPPVAPAQEPHIKMLAALTSYPMPAPPMPVAYSSPPVAFIHITAQDFLAIMVVVRNFAVTPVLCCCTSCHGRVNGSYRSCPCSEYRHPCSGSTTPRLVTYPSHSSSSSHRITSSTTCSFSSNSSSNRSGFSSSPTSSFDRSTNCSSFRSCSATG